MAHSSSVEEKDVNQEIDGSRRCIRWRFLDSDGTKTRNSRAIISALPTLKWVLY